MYKYKALSVMAACAVVFFGIGIASNSQAEAIEKGSFCNRLTPRDYESVFTRLPQVHALPKTGVLPFGPSSIRLSPLSEPILAGPARFGYALLIDSPRAPQSIKLGWVISVRVKSMNSHGEIGKVVARSHREIKVLRKFNASSVEVGLSGKPHLYLIELTVTRSQGKTLGSYQQYVRVMAPENRARLSVSSSSLHPGAVAYFRVENLGTTEIGLIGEEFAFERYDGKWSVDPASPDAFPRKALGGLSVGTSRFCRSFAIPSNTVPGRYRFRKNIAVGKSQVPLTAEFDVVLSVSQS